LPVEEAAAAAAAAALPDAAAAAAAAELASICLPGCPAQIKKRRRRRQSTEHNLAEQTWKALETAGRATLRICRPHINARE